MLDYWKLMSILIVVFCRFYRSFYILFVNLLKWKTTFLADSLGKLRLILLP